MTSASKKRIGIDMRMAGEGFGIGTYIVELVDALLRRRDLEFEYILFFEQTFSRGAYERFARIHPHCRLVSARYYSVQEQTVLPLILAREKLDLMHFPNFNAPILYPGRFIITIHDLIHHHVPGTKKINTLWRLGYRAAIRLAGLRAKRVIAVSQATKRDIQSILKVPPGKIEVIYEGVSEIFRRPPGQAELEAVQALYGVHAPYVLAVGVWRRYKNMPFLAATVSRLRKEKKLNCQLVLVGEADPHYPEIRQQITRHFAADPSGLVVAGKVPPDHLRTLYYGAQCFAVPSLFEGFGLPSLEAQAAGVPVASSNIPVAREILADSAIFFDPHDVSSCLDAIFRLVTNRTLVSKLRKQGLRNAEKFTWEKTAERTESVYREVLGGRSMNATTNTLMPPITQKRNS